MDDLPRETKPGEVAEFSGPIGSAIEVSMSPNISGLLSHELAVTAGLITALQSHFRIFAPLQCYVREFFIFGPRQQNLWVSSGANMHGIGSKPREFAPRRALESGDHSLPKADSIPSVVATRNGLARPLTKCAIQTHRFCYRAIFGKIFHPRNLRASAGNSLVFGCGFAAPRLCNTIAEGSRRLRNLF